MLNRAVTLQDLRVPPGSRLEALDGARAGQHSIRVNEQLSRFFDMSAEFWLGLQMDHDLDVAEDKLAKRLEQEVRPLSTLAV